MLLIEMIWFLLSHLKMRQKYTHNFSTSMHNVKTMIRCETLQMYLILSFHSRTFHDKASVIKVEYEMIYKHHAYVDSDKQ